MNVLTSLIDERLHSLRHESIWACSLTSRFRALRAPLRDLDVSLRAPKRRQLSERVGTDRTTQIVMTGRRSSADADHSVMHVTV